MTCVYKEYEVKIKMVQEQWLQLKTKTAAKNEALQQENFYLVGEGWPLVGEGEWKFGGWNFSR